MKRIYDERQLPYVLDIPMAAALLNCTEKQVRTMLHDGVLPGFKLGKKLWRVKKADVIAFIDNQTQRGGDNTVVFTAG